MASVTTVENIQGMCRRASDSALHQGEASAKSALRQSMARREIHNGSHSGMAASGEWCEVEIEGIWYILSVGYGYKNAEAWSFGRDWKKSPQVEEAGKANEQRAKFNRMFAK